MITSSLDFQEVMSLRVTRSACQERRDA